MRRESNGLTILKGLVVHNRRRHVISGELTLKGGGPGGRITMIRKGRITKRKILDIKTQAFG